MAVVNLKRGMGGTEEYDPRWFNGEPVPPGMRLLLNRKVQLVGLAVVVVVAVLSVWYQRAVVPELTAVEYEMWVAGDSNDLLIEVDNENGLVVVSNVPSGLPDVVVGVDDVFVRGDLIGGEASSLEWVSVPLEAVDSRFAALAPDRVGPAISRDVKQCQEMSTDAWSIVALLLAPTREVQQTSELCQRAVGGAADDGRTVLVSLESQRPSGTGAETATAMSYLELLDPDAVLRILEPAPSP